MSRRLMLLRHAKSDWSNPRLDDHERPLAARGVRDAPLMGAFMLRHGLKPDKALVSTALRARQTWELVRDVLQGKENDGPGAAAEHVAMLYAFDNPQPLLEAIRRHGGDARTLLLVGHNEAMHELAMLLAADGDDHAMRRLHEKFPTAALAVIDLPLENWQEIGKNTKGRLLHHVRPKDLRG